MTPRLRRCVAVLSTVVALICGQIACGAAPVDPGGGGAVRVPAAALGDAGSVSPDTAPDVCSPSCGPAKGPCVVWAASACTCIEVPKPDNATCDDGDVCTLADRCKGGVCATCPAHTSPASRPSKAPHSDPHKRCGDSPNTVGVGCDDGDPCTAKSTCEAGVCGGGRAAQCPCTADQDCADNSPDSPCEGVMFCDPATQQCAINPATVVHCPAPAGGVCSLNACDTTTGK